jgi:hypothetical protein
MELLAENVVITANKFNPSVLTQVWLVRNGILAEEDLGPSSFFPMAVQVQTPRFMLLAVPDFIQYAPVTPGSDGDLILRTMGGIARALPHTPFTGIGMNFVWTETPGIDIAELTRRLFFRADSPVFSPFDTEDAHFGGYMSKDFRGVRMKLDIKPTIWRKLDPKTETPQGVEPRLQFSFNFHKDLTPDDSTGNTPAEIESILRLWDAAKQESERIVSEGMRK